MQKILLTAPCVTSLFLFTGCAAQDHNTTQKIKPEMDQPKVVEKVIINGSPIPPSGYVRPTINIGKKDHKKE